jgi:hypothetical protein
MHHTLNALKKLNSGTMDLQNPDSESDPKSGPGSMSGIEVLVPQYDKSLRGGRGDRADKSKWIRASGDIKMTDLIQYLP